MHQSLASRPRPAPAPSAGSLTAPPATFPAGTEPEAFAAGSGARRVSLPFAAPTRAPLSAHEAARSPAAADPRGRGATCPHRAAGVPPRPADRDGAADPLPGRAVAPSSAGAGIPSGSGPAALYVPAGSLDLPATLTWSIPPREVAALAATLVFGIAAIVWFAALSGGL